MIDQVHAWLKVASDLGIQVAAPCEVHLSNGARLHVTALVKEFGAEKGMVVDPDFATFGSHRETLLADGYGYCAMELDAAYDRAALIDMLADWGWSSQHPSPVWLTEN